MSDTLVLNSDGLPLNILPISTLNWQDSIKCLYLDSVQVLDVYDDWDVHSPSVTISVPSVIMVKSKVFTTRFLKFTSSYVFLRDRYICQYCEKSFPEKELTLDHVIPKMYGGTTRWDNISTACGNCNSKRGHNRNIQPIRKPWKPSYWELVKTRKEFPLTVPCKSWGFYLDWPEQNLILREKKSHN